VHGPELLLVHGPLSVLVAGVQQEVEGQQALRAPAEHVSGTEGALDVLVGVHIEPLHRVFIVRGALGHDGRGRTGERGERGDRARQGPVRGRSCQQPEQVGPQCVGRGGWTAQTTPLLMLADGVLGMK